MNARIESLRELNARVRLEDVVAGHMTLHGQGAVRTGQCPIHGGRHNSFAVYLTTQTWYCFSAVCERGGDVIDFLGYLQFGPDWNSRDRAQIRAVVASLEGGALQDGPSPTAPLARPERPYELEPRLQEVLHLAASLYHTTLLDQTGPAGAANAYLREVRGFTPATIWRHALGYADGDRLRAVLAAHRIATDDAAAALLIRPESGRERLAGRIIFGERDRTGRVLHLIGRRFAPWLSPDAPKYLALSELTKPLYGYARLDRRPSAKPVFLVEGPPDQLTLNQWGHDALANLGTRLTPHHATLLAALRRPLVVVPNNDAESGAGLAAAEQWVTRIGHGQLLRLPADVKDVNEMAQQPRGWAQWAGLLAGLRVV